MDFSNKITVYVSLRENEALNTVYNMLYNLDCEEKEKLCEYLLQEADGDLFQITGIVELMVHRPSKFIETIMTILSLIKTEDE